MESRKAIQLATAFAREVCKRTGATLATRENPYGVRVRNKAETYDHGYASGALASITFEGADDLMIAMTMDREWIDKANAVGVYFEPYASYLIAIYADR